MKISKVLILLLVISAACTQKTKQQAIKPLPPKKVSFEVEFNAVPDSFYYAVKDSVKHYFQNVLELNDLNGAFLFAKNGKIIWEKYQGMADVENEKSFSADIPVHVASISKVATAVAVLRLVDQEKIE